MKNNKINQEVEDVLNFKWYPEKKIEETEVESKVIDKNKNTHILLFGGSDTGKMYFIKQYLEKNHISKCKVFCLDTDEWPDHVTETDFEKLNNLGSLKDYTIILDNQGNMKLDKQLANIISKGRHFNIQLFFLAHLSTDLNPKSRNNVKEIYITTGNSKKKFFHDIKRSLWYQFYPVSDI